ncbi:putative Pre-mRNA-splicing factor clf1 [Blattamonas nauphoetae]|uniref:Pre-mRNA-splicing factor clf1 n=1 Tax=Blattamonas nauphoetae TaxID=2049346 RepID=A0ABQ9YKI3_9EUKA|nr:putative Pre-mRNA-splicing factor clf1 [Blattamonas nauphoetae]
MNLEKNRGNKVLNKTPAPVQVTAEQLLIKTRERQEKQFVAPKQTIEDQEELLEYQTRRRKEFEDRVRAKRFKIGVWLLYAKFEEEQEDFVRSRSVYERALQVDDREVKVWLAYTEMEMRHQNVNHARNLFDRATRLLPRQDILWFKYITMEERLGNITHTRDIYQRWMQYLPEANAYRHFIKFEMKYHEWDNCVRVFEQYVAAHHTADTFLKYAKWLEKHYRGTRQTLPDGRQGPAIVNAGVLAARNIYERALAELEEWQVTEELFQTYADFEERAKDFERTRAVYARGMKRFPESTKLFSSLATFEKRFGTMQTISETIIQKRKRFYEEALAKNSLDYDKWFDYIQMIEYESDDDVEARNLEMRDLYQRAIVNIPPGDTKPFWRRYIYLWIEYALFEEVNCGNQESALQVLTDCLKVIPHKSFTFGKIWVHKAKLEIRMNNLQAARQTLGRAIGLCGKPKIFREYLKIEKALDETDRCRKILQMQLKQNPNRCACWVAMCKFEAENGEDLRARGLYEEGLRRTEVDINNPTQPQFDNPFALWKEYIEFEIENGEKDNVRALYRRLLNINPGIEVWISFALYESGKTGSEGETEQETRETNIKDARGVFEEAERTLIAQAKNDPSGEKRKSLYESWLQFEETYGTEETIETIQSKQPQGEVRQRPIYAADGVTAVGLEEYIHYDFPTQVQAHPLHLPGSDATTQMLVDVQADDAAERRRLRAERVRMRAQNWKNQDEGEAK